MSVPPLTHHEIIRRAAPFAAKGWRVKLSACDRAARYMEFEAQPGHHSSTSVVYCLNLADDNRSLIERVVLHSSGLVSVLSAFSDDINSTLDSFDAVSLSRQIDICDGYLSARSYTMSSYQHNDETLTKLDLRFVVAQLSQLELRIDVSTGGGMPADVWLLSAGASEEYLRSTLADGGDIPLHHRAAQSLRMQIMVKSATVETRHLPDDLLAVLGPQWRPLRWQGDHWKGVLRQLGTRNRRTDVAEAHISKALEYLHTTLNSSPEKYHERNTKARWRVYVRRLQPLMLFIGILALMPVSWFFVSSGTVSIHPLALGLTPLLMVGVVALTAREIPIMEIPPRPGPLTGNTWASHPD